MSYRLYSFVNHLYMSPLQWGIQTAHVVSTMSTYKHNTPEYAMYDEWARTDPTIIVCQGGNVAMLKDLFLRLSDLADALGLPCVAFHEDEQSLGGALTAVGVLVPDYLFGCRIVGYEDNLPRFQRPKFVDGVATFDDDAGNFAFSAAEYDFLSIVKTARLA